MSKYSFKTIESRAATKNKVIIICAVIILIIAAIIMLLLKSDIGLHYEESVIAPESLYEDRSTVIEPDIKVGKYYLNGDNSDCYFEVYDGNKILLAGTYEQLFELYSSGYVFYDDELSSEEKEKFIPSIETDIAKWNHPKEFYAQTRMYPSDESYSSGIITYENCDKELTNTYLLPSNEEDRWTNAILYFDENTLSYKGFSFEYVNTENN